MIAGCVYIQVDDDGAGYIIYTATSLGHTMAVERLTDDYLASAAAPTPKPTPVPAPPPKGYKFVGQGACRDTSDKEPGWRKLRFMVSTNSQARR